MIRFFAAVLPLLAALLCLSCSAQVKGSLNTDGQADLFIQAALEPRMTMLIGSFAAASGTAAPGAPVINGPAIAASMAAAPGIASITLKNTKPAAVEGPVKIAKIGDFLAASKANGSANAQTGGLSTNKFISFEQNPPPAASGGRCTINISLETGPEMLGLISPDINAYLSALMAPLATGEVLAKAEYLALVASVYGKGISDEIAKALFRASIDFPGPVQSVKGGTFSGTKAELAIPLLELLVLETPLSYEVVWK